MSVSVFDVVYLAALAGCFSLLFLLVRACGKL